MKNKILKLSAVLLAVGLTACGTPHNDVAETERLMIIRDEMKYGAINSDGEYVIEPEYDYMTPFGDNGWTLAYISDGNGGYNYKYIDSKGNTTLSLEHIESIETACPFYMGLARVKVNERWGYINSDGEFAIEHEFTYAEDFNEYGVSIAAIDMKEGVIDTNGNWVVQPEYDRVYEFTEDGFAFVENYGEEVGVVDYNGNYILKPDKNITAVEY